MIHTFMAVGQKMALDVGSGAVHALDDGAYDALTMAAEHSPEEIERALTDKYGAEEARDILAELRALEQMGALNAPDDYSDIEPVETGTVKAMCLHAAHDCNLRCRYCFASAGEYHLRKRTLLSYDTGKAALEWLTRMSGKRHNLEVDFFGGEPLMNFPVVRQLVLYGRELEKRCDKHFKFTVTTNALLLNDEMIDFFNEQMDNVVLSIDGRPDVHDRMRPTANGQGSFGLIFPKAKKLADKRGQERYYVRGTYTRYNKDFAKDVLFLRDSGFEQLSVEPVVAPEDCEYALTMDDVPELCAEYEELAEKYIAYRKSGKWFNFFHFMVDLSGGPCLRKRLTGCGAGNEYVAVTPEGDIYPCHQFVGRDGYRMGSVLDGSFDRDIQRRFAQNTVLKKEKCSACWARFFCSGGCAANAQAFHGDIAKPHELECALEQKRLECALAIYAVEHRAE